MFVSLYDGLLMAKLEFVLCLFHSWFTAGFLWQGDWAWLKRLPDGTFSSINPKTNDVFELVCETSTTIK